MPTLKNKALKSRPIEDDDDDRQHETRAMNMSYLVLKCLLSHGGEQNAWARVRAANPTEKPGAIIRRLIAREALRLASKDSRDTIPLPADVATPDFQD